MSSYKSKDKEGVVRRVGKKKYTSIEVISVFVNEAHIYTGGIDGILRIFDKRVTHSYRSIFILSLFMLSMLSSIYGFSFSFLFLYVSLYFS